MNIKSGIRIATFNIRKFSRYSVFSTSEKESPKDLDTIGKIIRENQFDIIAIQEIFHKEALKELLEKIALQYAVEERLYRGSKYTANPFVSTKTSESFGYRTKHWEGRWASLNSRYGDSEGYAFIWNRDRVKLVTNRKKEVFEPRIEEYISTTSEESLVRPPFLGRFMPINGRYEIRLINTHIAYSVPSKKRREDDANYETDLTDIAFRNQEFETLIQTIYRRFSQKQYDINRLDQDAECLVPYTFLLGDYNLNVSKYPQLRVASDGFIVKGNNKQDTMKIVTLNSDLTTLKNRPEDKPENHEKLKMWIESTSDEYHMANNYDHFSFDDVRLDSNEKGIGIAIPRSTVVHPFDYFSEQARKSETNETVYDIYSKRVSDHVPVYIDFDVRKKRQKG